MVIPLIKQGDKTPLLNLEPSSGAMREAGLAGFRPSEGFCLSPRPLALPRHSLKQTREEERYFAVCDE